MQLPEDWQRAITRACEAFKAGKTQLDQGLAEFAIFMDLGFVMVKVHDAPDSDSVASVFTFAKTLGKAQQLPGGIQTTDISILPN